MALGDDIIGTGVLALGRRLRQRTLSCRELMQETLRRIDRLNPAHNAIVALRDPDDLLREADEADADIARGLWRGPLHGIPQAPKDLAPTRGIRTTWGSPIYRDFVPMDDGIAVARMRWAGAIFIGKTNTPEWGLGSHSYNPVYGVTRNAWNPALSAGGSSGGAGVALALGILSVADGSDMGGSLRNPAGWNNVFGFRPTWGRVPSSAPDDVFMNQLSTDGPMGVTVEDVAALLTVQSGYDPRAPLSLDTTLGFEHVYEGTLRDVRIGWIGDWNGHLPTEPGVLDLCEAALARMTEAGAIVELVVPPFHPERLWRAWLELRNFMVGSKLRPHYDDPARRALLKPEAQWEVENGLGQTALDVYNASMNRTAWCRAVDTLFNRYDLLALPTAQVFPFPAEWTWPKEIAGRTMDTYHRWMEVVIGPTMAGCPAVSVPVGRDALNRPMGLQLWGPARADQAVLSVAAAWERIAPDLCHARPQ